MCSCRAHHELVDCTCNCDHVGDRMIQYSDRAKQLANRLRTARVVLEHVAAIPLGGMHTHITTSMPNTIIMNARHALGAIDWAQESDEI